MSEGDIANRLEEMKARSLSGELLSSDKEFIKQYYERITFREFNARSCSRCYSDAFIEMYTTFKKYRLRDMPNFRLKRGVVIKSATIAEVYTNSNLTDEIALKWLKENPKRIDFFEIYPKNWDKKEPTKTGEKKTSKKQAKITSKE